MYYCVHAGAAESLKILGCTFQYKVLNQQYLILHLTKGAIASLEPQVPLPLNSIGNISP